MSDFEDKLGSLLKNPQEMEKIIGIARSIMGGGESVNPAPPAMPAPEMPVPMQGYAPPQYAAAPPYPPPALPPQQSYAPPYSPPPPAPPAQEKSLGSLIDGLDLGVLKKLTSGLTGGGTAALLQAVTPHLKETRKSQLGRAVSVAQMVRVAKSVLVSDS